MTHFNKNIPSWLALLLINFVLLASYLGFVSKADFFASGRLKAIDTLFELRHRLASAPDRARRVVIIGVDDASYHKLNRQWPWGREVFAVFLDHLRPLEPAVVGVDFSFIGKSPDPSTDEWLAESLTKTKKAVLVSYFSKDGAYTLPLDILTDSAAAVGFASKPIDRDAVTRRSQLTAEFRGNGGRASSFAMQMASLYLGPDELSRLDRKTASDRPVWLSYRYKPDAFPHFSFWQVIVDEVPKEAIEGRIVIVAPISLIFHDHHPTPLGVMQGSYSIANELLMILDNDFIREVPPFWHGAFLGLWMIAFTFIFYARFGYITKLFIFIISEALFYGVCAFLFAARGVLLEPLPGMILLAATYLCNLFYKGLVTFLENRALQKLVITDFLTGIYDHRYLSLKVKMEFDWRQNTKGEFFFVMIDIDLFKKVNDKFGHEEGNTVLVAVAKILKSGIRGSDVVARYGGEEFSLILFDVDEKGVFQTVERIRSAVEAHKFSSEKGLFHVTISAGICSNKNSDVKSAQDLIKCADQALYQAKAQGRNRTCIYSAGTQTVVH